MSDSSDTERLARKIWPGARLVRRHSPTSYVVLPSAQDPRLLLPSKRRLAVAALRARTTPTSRRERLRNDAVAAIVTLGGVRPLRGGVIETAGAEPTLLDQVSMIVGTPVSAGVHLGPPRANRKPVLALLDQSGDVVAYVKLGVNDLTSTLVRNEAAALVALADRGDEAFVTPRPMWSGVWRGTDALVMTPLHLPARPRLPVAGALGRVVRAIAASGAEREESARALLDRVAADNRALGPQESPTLDAFVQQLRAWATDLVLPTGAWHGDFAPGNVVTTSDGRLAVLDWERYEATGAPLGMDLAHYMVRHDAHTLGHGMGAAIAAIAPTAPSLLGQLGLDRLGSHLVFSIYLCRLAVRYLSDDNFGTEDRERTMQEWFQMTTAAQPA